MQVEKTSKFLIFFQFLDERINIPKSERYIFVSSGRQQTRKVRLVLVAKCEIACAARANKGPIHDRGWGSGALRGE